MLVKNSYQYFLDPETKSSYESKLNTDPALHFSRCSDVDAAHEIERVGFPASEAASLETLQFRQREAPALFFGAYQTSQITGRVLVGYVTSTQSKAERILHDSMTTHDVEGSLVVLHSVCVQPQYQKQGIATQLMKAYLLHLKHLKSVLPIQKVALLSHQPLTSWYEKLGFQNLGISSVNHGPEPWYEMELIL